MRAAQQLRGHQWAEENLKDGPGLLGDYSTEMVRNRLQGLKHLRRSFPFHRIESQGIIVFGALHWERYGMWSSLDDLLGCEVFEYDRVLRESEKGEGEEAASFLETKLRHRIEERKGVNPPSCVVFYADSKFISPNLLRWLRSEGIWTILIGLDDKHRFSPRKEGNRMVGQATIASEFDLVWTTWKNGVQFYLALGALPWYAPPAADPRYFRAKPSSYSGARDPSTSDVSFVGKRYGRRATLVNRLASAGFDVQCYGEGWPAGSASFDVMINTFQSAGVTLGVGDVGYMTSVAHLKGRDFEAPMAGALYLTSYNRELCDHYHLGEEIVCYSSAEECVESVSWLLANPKRANEIRVAGMSRAIRDHTWSKRFGQLLSLFPE